RDDQLRMPGRGSERLAELDQMEALGDLEARKITAGPQRSVPEGAMDVVAARRRSARLGGRREVPGREAGKLGRHHRGAGSRLRDPANEVSSAHRSASVVSTARCAGKIGCLLPATTGDAPEKPDRDTSETGPSIARLETGAARGGLRDPD